MATASLPSGRRSGHDPRWRLPLTLIWLGYLGERCKLPQRGRFAITGDFHNIEYAPFAQHRKVWLTPTTRVPCSNAANIGERKTWTQSDFFHMAKFRHGARAPPQKKMYKCRPIYSVPAHETAKHRAKFGWLPLSDVAAVTKSRCETR